MNHRAIFPFLAGRALLLAEIILLLAATRVSAIVPWSILINTNNVVNVTNYGAIGDGVTTNTAAIQNAINAANAGGTVGGLIGGTVKIPAGVFLSGPITLKNNVNLQVDGGGILRMLPFGAYPVSWFTNNVTNVYFLSSADFISGNNLTNIAISGPGAIDGQGLPWWPWANTNNADRPVMISLSGCNRELIQNITLSNSPMFHIAIGGSAKNSTVQGVTIRAPSSGASPPSHNTDACDVSGTNIFVHDCDISVGDDNFTCGGNTSDILISNNIYGDGHGVSIGSYTSPYVANMTVVNCSFNNTDQGIRIKTDRDRGGFVHNINYYNLKMTNVMRAILIYCQYNAPQNSPYRSIDSISPGVAASYPSAAVTDKTPYYRDITISNLTATTQSGRAAGLIWGLPESSISNVTLMKISVSSQKTFGIYCAKNVQLIDCTNTILSSGVNQYSFYDSQVVFSNTVTSATMVTLDGVTSNGIANNFSFFNFLPTLKNTNALNLGSSVTLSSSTFTVSNNLALTASNALNFALGTNAATIVVKGNLVLGGTNNILAGAGFTNGIYTLMTYTGALSGSLPTLGSVPFNYNYTYDTNTVGQVKLVAVSTAPQVPPAPANLTASAGNARVTLNWSVAVTATNYYVKRSLVSGGSYSTVGSTAGTSFTNTGLSNGTNYFYVVSGVNAVGEGANSAEVSATPQAPVPPAVTNVFSDDFSTSTFNSVSPSAPTPFSTSYQLMSSKTWNPSPSIGAGHLKFGIGSTTSGCIEAQALFTNSPVILDTVGDSISLIITFTNTSGLLTSNCSLGFGLYASGQNAPVPGGLNSTATTSSSDAASGYAQTWAGYFGQLSFTNANSQIMARPAQTNGAPGNNVQDCVTTGSGSSSFGNPTGQTVGTASTAPSLALTAGNPYTEVLTITLVDTNVLAITNSLYAGAGTNGVLLSQFGGVASGSTYLTNGFDAFAIGWRETGNQATTIDISKILVTAALAPSGPESLAPTNIVTQVSGDQLQLSWPPDHLGWRLEIQTNDLVNGIGTNWVTVPNSTSMTQYTLPINPTNGSVFLRMAYP